jgi:hypothetical protein
MMSKGHIFSRAETELLSAVNSGRRADYRLPDFDSGEDFTGRTVSGETIRAIIEGVVPGVRPTAAGLRIAGARIVGDIQLTSLRFGYPLEMIKCHVDSPIKLTGAKLEFLNLAGSHIESVDAASLEVSSGVFWAMD